MAALICCSPAIGFLFGMSGASHYALCMGSGRPKKARQYFSSSVWMTLITGSIAAIALNLVAEPFAMFLGADEASLPYAMPYLRVLLCYIPGFMMDVLMMSFMKNEGHPTIAMIATVTGSLLNVILDFVFVFGLDMGMFGAAFATALCSGIGLCINIVCAAALHTNLKLEMPSWHSKTARNILSNGFSILVLEASSGIVTFVFVHQAARLYGENGAGIYTILMNWSLIFTNLTMGIAQAMQPLVSFACGRGNHKLMHFYLRLSLICALILGALDMILSIALAGPMASVFTSDSEVILPVVLALLLPLVLGGTGLWTAMPVSEAVTAVVSLVLLRSPLTAAADSKPEVYETAE